MYKPQYYGQYLELDKILDAQHPVSFQENHNPAHDEMLFIVIHQAYELWFKQILFEMDSVLQIMGKPVDDNSPELQTVVHRINRVNTILKVLVHQIDILETMPAMDFLDFRDMLRPASGFQSWQFKVLEAKLGLRFHHRHGQDYYLSQLNESDLATIKEAENGPALLPLVNLWLERMPFLKNSKLWEGFNPEHNDSFIDVYEELYKQSLSISELNNLDGFHHVFHGVKHEGVHRSLTPTACRSALFIMLYRGYPLLELPYQLLDGLLEMDNQLGSWRFRHINMVKRMIGSRVGTGGSTGAGYLQGAMDKHFIFKEISQLTSFLIERSKLPGLPKQVVEVMGYKIL
jgi:tryptophan 2,3-dioxygenase